ncbi:MAG TPA: SDR family oxidoreductase [Acidimicrobiia bacterium]|nr:SDR family oxidoreductase [Acidimicrobiia bacterium]
MGICDGRVVIVTGSGRGIGREHALAYAAEGAKVVVNDLGGDTRGEGGDLSPAMEVVEEIKAMGGEAVADGENVADYAGAGRMVQRAIDSFGRLDTIVNNAGILRDRMLTNMEESEWDAVIAVHLKGTFGPTKHAAAYWREQAKAGTPVNGRIVNTSSPSGLFGNAGQTNYGAAKAGIAAFTIICGIELSRYNVCANAIAPVARTRMTEDLGFGAAPEGKFDALDPANISPLVVWLGSNENESVNGRVFLVDGDRVSVAEGWHRGPTARNDGMRWEPSQLTKVVPDLVAQAAEPSNMLS